MYQVTYLPLENFTLTIMMCTGNRLDHKQSKPPLYFITITAKSIQKCHSNLVHSGANDLNVSGITMPVELTINVYPK